MLAMRKMMIPLFVVLVAATSVPAVMKYPLYALASSLVFLLFVLYAIVKVESWRMFSLAAFALLMSFNLFTTSLGTAIFMGLVGLYVVAYLADPSYRRQKTWTTSLTFFILWITYAVIQLFWVVHTPRTYLHMHVMVIGIAVIWFMTRMIDSANWLEKLYKVWGFSVLATVIIGWWELTTDKHLPNSGADFYQLKHVATATFFNPNDYCFFLMVSLPVVLHWIKGKVIYKLLGLFMLISAFYFMYADEARFMILMMIACLCMFLVGLIKNHKKLLLLFLTTVAITVYLNYDLIEKSFKQISSLQASNDSSVGARKFLTDSAWQIFKDHPWGVGPGNVETYMPVVGFGSNVHNFWLEILANYGVVIFVGFAMFFISSLRTLYKGRKNESLKQSITPAFSAALIFIPACVQSSSVFAFNVTWFVFGLMVCAVNIIKRDSQV